jgi:hypothetical protein
MPQVLYTVLGLLMLTAALAFIGWLMVRALKRSDDPVRLIVKWVVTALVGGVLVFILGGFAPSFGSAFVVPFVCLGLGVVLSFIWASSIGSILSRPLTALFDGGLEEAKPEPLYSTAQARRKRGRYQEALWEIHQQLEKFPNDFTGQMLMAEIQADDLKDLQAAHTTVHRLCHQTSHPPSALAAALNQLADWQLKYTQDITAARQTLEEVVQRLPDSPWSHAASQRLAHLGDTDSLLAQHDRRPVHMVQTEPILGLGPGPALPSAQESPAEAAQRLVKHLGEFPEDNEAREQLALLYAHQYQRLDLASLELEQLIAQPNAPSRKTVHWLNLLADLQIELARDEEAARQALQRIIDLFPGHAAADLAGQRQSRLKLELKKGEAAKSLKLGTYEQDLGLKWGSPPGRRSEPASPASPLQDS